jgi:hypothetical protein
VTAETGTHEAIDAVAAPTRARRLRGPLLVGVAVLASATYVGLVDPNATGHYPLCPTKYLTGLDCPGCGGLRSVHALMHGDVVGALDHNALVVLLIIPVAVALWVRSVIRAWRGTPPPETEPWWSRRAVLWAAVALFAVFTVVRNVPDVAAFAWLSSSLS